MKTEIQYYKGMPILELKSECGECGYLSPFRRSNFQVSGNLKGEEDKGSTSSVPLAPLPIEVLRWGATLAVWKWIERKGIKDPTFPRILTRLEFDLYGDEIISDFFKEVRDYLLKKEEKSLSMNPCS